MVTVFPCSWKEASFGFLMEHRGIPGEPCGDSSGSWEFHGWLLSPPPRPPTVGSCFNYCLSPFPYSLRMNSSFLCLLISPLPGSAVGGAWGGGLLRVSVLQGRLGGEDLVKCYLEASLGWNPGVPWFPASDPFLCSFPNPVVLGITLYTGALQVQNRWRKVDGERWWT